MFDARHTPTGLPTGFCYAHLDRVRMNIQSNEKLDTLFHGRSPLVADDSFSACSSARLAAQPTSPRPAASLQRATIVSNDVRMLRERGPRCSAAPAHLHLKISEQGYFLRRGRRFRREEIGVD